MLKEKFEKDLEKIIDILKNCELNSSSYGWDFYEDVVMPLKKNSIYCSYDNGATRGVLIFKDYNFVIKFPFTEDLDGDPVYGACGLEEGDDWDYCYAETLLYEEANNDIKQCFAPVECIGYSADDIPIYIQEKAKLLGSVGASHSSDEQMTKVKNLCKEEQHYCFNSDWLGSLLEAVGKDIFNNFMNYIKDKNINDLHSGNIGFIGDKPVLVDYAGYHCY